jgi:hypothetical protein
MKLILGAVLAMAALTLLGACSTGDGLSADYHKGYSAGKADTTLLNITPIDSACALLAYMVPYHVNGSADWFKGCHDGEQARETG